MKKVFSLLFVALLAMSAWAGTVTFIPGETVGNNLAANAYDEMSLNGVTITCTSGAFKTNPYRFGGGSTATVSSTVGNITKVEFHCIAPYNDNYGPNQFYGDGYSTYSGSKVGTWQGDTASFTLNLASQSRVEKIVVTIADPVVEELVPPVFNPNGGEFSGSLEVTLSCATQNAQIFYFEGTPEGDWAGFDHYSHPFYVTETKTFTAYSTKGDDMSEFVTVTFTKVEQTVAAPVFNPASCSFQDRLDVTLSCETPNAKIFYSLDNDLWSEYVTPIPVTDDLTIWAKAAVGDVESEVVSATYNKLPATTVEVSFDASVDTGNGSTTRHSYTVVKDPVTMYVGDGTVYPDHYRIYPSDSSAFVFTSSGAPIIKIELNSGTASQTPSNLSLPEGQSGTYTTSGRNGIWEGEDQEVSFKVNAQVRCYSIIVTLAGETTYERGDADHDGRVTVKDIATIIEYLLTDPTQATAESDCDLNESVNVRDVAVLVNYMLTQQWPE